MELTENQLTQQYKQCLNEILVCTEHAEIPELLKLEHVFEFINKNLQNVGQNIHMADILPILHHSIRLELNSNKNLMLSEKMMCLFSTHKTQCLEPLLQVLYQILETLSSVGVKRSQIGDEVFKMLIEILHTENNTPLINANILACLKLFVKNFQASEILTNLWLKIETNLSTNNETALQILTTLYDDFAVCKNITRNFEETLQTKFLIESLIKSEEHDKRKVAYFLLKKSYVFWPGSPQFWTTCINIFENLEENQSHLILPSLELLKNVEPKNNQQLSWLHILLNKILQHNNILVRRWVIEYFLEYQTLDTLPPENIFQFLQSLNETALYNIEGYMLPTKHIPKFLQCHRQKLLQNFSHVVWKAVPLHFWLMQLLEHWKTVNSNDILEVDQEVLLSLASKIRALQNVQLRREIIEVYGDLFATTIASMDLFTYVELIKTLHNVSDPFYGVDLLSKKFELISLNELKGRGKNVFDQRFYEITNNAWGSYNSKKHFAEILFEKLKGSDCSDCHGYLSLFVIFDLRESPEKQAFCQHHYDLDMSSLTKVKSFTDFYDLIVKKLHKFCENKVFLRRKATDFYTQHTFKNFNELQNCDITLKELLNAGSGLTILHLSRLLANYNKHVEDNIIENFLDSFSEHSRNLTICSFIYSNLLKYFRNVFEPKHCAYWEKRLLELGLENSDVITAVLPTNIKLNDEQFLIKGALNGDAKTGDSRIEESYLHKFNAIKCKSYYIRYLYVIQITIRESTTIKQSIALKICDMAKALNLKKPRYFANSREHRMLIRMTCLLWKLRDTEMAVEKADELFEKLWSLLMDYNNQPNVAIIYECLIARVANYTKLMEKIRKLQNPQTKCTSSQEVSMIMLFYRYFEYSKCESLKEFTEAITFLWPLTMGSSFQTRLYAQLVVVALIGKFELKIEEPTADLRTFQQLKKAVEQMIGRKEIDEFLKDVRFLPTDTDDFYDEVMFLTQTPFDEYGKKTHHFKNEENLPKKKLMAIAKGEHPMEEQRNDNCNIMAAADVQRKLNPMADFMPQSNLISYPACKDHELFVVASFIDKIPNLGGIARTCEVLGIHNLVMASKADLTKADFKNLSMTAEKTLNIIEVKPIHLQEFLMQKKSEGFSIIGAEQTAKSCSFVDFKFPKRSLLLLGHEKEGIPPNFLGFLDYAVEIPQFGMVRSLNVHVTGALFMWEYCKQHICKENN